RLAAYTYELQKDPKVDDKEKGAAKQHFRQVYAALLDAAQSDKAPRVRAAAASALGKSGSLDITEDRESKKAVTILMALLKEKQEDVREAAAEALARMGPAASGAVPELLEAAKDKTGERFFRIHAVFALGRVTGKESSESVVPVLAEIL